MTASATVSYTHLFIAAVIGGIGNIKGAVVGALMLGVLEILLVWRLSLIHI